MPACCDCKELSIWRELDILNFRLQIEVVKGYAADEIREDSSPIWVAGNSQSLLLSLVEPENELTFVN